MHMKIDMQVSLHETFLTQVGYFSHAKPGEMYNLGEMTHLI